MLSTKNRFITGFLAVLGALTYTRIFHDQSEINISLELGSVLVVLFIIIPVATYFSILKFRRIIGKKIVFPNENLETLALLTFTITVSIIVLLIVSLTLIILFM